MMGFLELFQQDHPILWNIASLVTISVPVIAGIGAYRKWGLGPTVSWFKAHGENLAIIGIIVAVVGGGGWGLYSGISWFRNRPPAPVFEWIHPTMPSIEQERAMAECRMLAAAETSDAHPYELVRARTRYEQNCFISRGFTYEQVLSSQEEEHGP